MKQLFRILFNGAALLSGALFVASAVLWMASYRTVYSVTARHLGRIYCLDSSAGSVAGVHVWMDNTEVFPQWRVVFDRDYQIIQYADWPFAWRWLGFGRQRMVIGYEPGDTEPTIILNAFTTPYWFVCGMLLLAPLLAFRARLHRLARHRLGLCSACGYDLRAVAAALSGVWQDNRHGRGRFLVGPRGLGRCSIFLRARVTLFIRGRTN